jgi:ribose transport system permease protein
VAGSAAEVPAKGSSDMSSSLEAADGIARSTRWNAAMHTILAKYSLLVVWAVMIVVFSIVEPTTFLSRANIVSLIAGQSITAVVALALVFPIASGNFDLSIQGSVGVGIVLPATLMATLGFAQWPAILITLAMGLMIGLLNTLIIVKWSVDSFIATLGTSSIILAVIQWVTGGNQISTGIPQSFLDLGQTNVLGLPLVFYYMVIISAVMWYILEHRQLGRYLYATGSNAEAARLAGVRTTRLQALGLLVSGTLGAFAGLLFLMQVGATSLTAGPLYLLPAFAAALLGATQIRPRSVNVLGTLVAVYALATGVNGVQLMGAPYWVVDLFNGVALIAAVALSIRSTKKRLGR